MVVLHHQAEFSIVMEHPSLDGDISFDSALYYVAGPSEHETVLGEKSYDPVSPFDEQSISSVRAT